MLFTLTDNATGACVPAIDYIATKAGAARSTVCEALKQLERVGLVRIMRRLIRRVVRDGHMRRESTVQDTNA
jgi:DNA-binding transcriptional regulator YhcF (GntR family)